MTGPGTGETAKGAWGHRPPGTAVAVTIAETADIRGVSCSVSFFPQESERRGVLRNRGFPPGSEAGLGPQVLRPRSLAQISLTGGSAAPAESWQGWVGVGRGTEVAGIRRTDATLAALLCDAGQTCRSLNLPLGWVAVRTESGSWEVGVAQGTR